MQGSVMGRITINGTQSQFFASEAAEPSAVVSGASRCPCGTKVDYHISPKCKERTFLTEEELKAVMAHKFEDANLAFVRDLFVFMNFTALSFVDLKDLTTNI